MTQKRITASEPCPPQEKQGGQKKHDLTHTARTDVGPERQSGTAQRREKLAPAGRQVSNNMCRDPQKKGTNRAIKGIFAHGSGNQTRSQKQNNARMRQSTMTHRSSQKAGQEFHPRAKH
ncbi:hypothetical protein AA0228_1969 [Gluconobacter frateurii NRIC 0228]|uniref:Uncharacterized protein n=1 Tax=Gluconobacter frateurii NRIC 0228 TaxID=1307946 RepID=A0ABQ0QCR2_9PROT|nr:hypothetical protein AA0228_1969 [Gluconobacter frateurii NRIC 0228]